MKTFQTRWIFFVLVGGLMCVTVPVARADLTLTLTSGAATQTMTSNTGFVNFVGPVGGWDINGTTGLALFNLPLMDLGTLSASTGGTPTDLIITLTGTGFTAPVSGLTTTLSALTLMNASVTYNTFLNGSLIGSQTVSGSSSVAVNPGVPFSLQQVLTIHDLSGGTSVASVDAQVATPEPASLIFLGTVLIGLAVGCKRKFLSSK
jgi:hypothetical protein